MVDTTVNRRLPKGLIFFIGIIFISLSALGTVHANNKHPEAPNIRKEVEGNTCRSVEVFYSPRLGKLLLGCQMTNKNAGTWGILIYRISYHYGTEFVPVNELRELTAYSLPTRRYRRMLIRDGYAPMMLFGDLVLHLSSWLEIMKPN